MTRQLFFIREKKTNTWCQSSKHRTFHHEFIAASIFHTEDNAKKAIKEIKNGLDPKKSTGPCFWAVYTDTDCQPVYYTPVPDRAANSYATLYVPDFEVVTYNLMEVE